MTFELKMKVTGYIYNADTLEVLAEVTGSQDEVDRYVIENYDLDTVGLTYSSNGLTIMRDTQIINL